ncbi:unnamed protein product [Gongylonema pulchrum]|uniref:Uncharacterized protein n=1 Tax=Gongylonema pulchrum TaxID=637853 RepID=A0A183DLV2_9BILA|nr:unnamed protein product [Gongylonema pulchrum]
MDRWYNEEIPVAGQMRPSFKQQQRNCNGSRLVLLVLQRMIVYTKQLHCTAHELLLIHLIEEKSCSCWKKPECRSNEEA